MKKLSLILLAFLLLSGCSAKPSGTGGAVIPPKVTAIENIYLKEKDQEVIAIVTPAPSETPIITATPLPSSTPKTTQKQSTETTITPRPTETPTPKPTPSPTPVPIPTTPPKACPGGENQNKPCDAILDESYFYNTYTTYAKAKEEGERMMNEVKYYHDLEITNYAIDEVKYNNGKVAHYGLNLMHNGEPIQ